MRIPMTDENLESISGAEMLLIALCNAGAIPFDKVIETRRILKSYEDRLERLEEDRRFDLFALGAEVMDPNG